jgi:ATP-dependent Clp protease ATP-binding subunit ClpC
VQRVDIWRPLDDQARELLSRAAQAAADWGSPDLDVEHLLWAATQLPTTRQVLERAGVPVDALAEEMEQAVEHGEPRGSAPPLTPAAKRALQDAHRQAQAAGSPGIGAEHVLLGLGANPESRAAQALARALPDTDQLQGRPGGRQQRGASSTPTLDEHSRDLTADAREDRLDPASARRRCLLRPPAGRQAAGTTGVGMWLTRSRPSSSIDAWSSGCASGFQPSRSSRRPAHLAATSRS